MSHWKRSLIIAPEVGPAPVAATEHNFHIRMGTSADKAVILPFINDLRSELGIQVTPTADEDLKNIDFHYHARGGMFWAVEEGEQLIATLGLFPRTLEICELRKFYLHRDYRGKKIGTKLIHEFIAKAKALGFSRVELESPLFLSNALHLYKKSGFKRTRRVGKNCLDSRVFVLEL